jgi:hypothetical protein
MLVEERDRLGGSDAKGAYEYYEDVRVGAGLGPVGTLASMCSSCLSSMLNVQNGLESLV